MQPGIIGPESYPIRDPRDRKMNVGRVANPPRMCDMGGLSFQNQWHKDYPTGAQSEQTNQFGVDRATSVKAAKKPESAYEI